MLQFQIRPSIPQKGKNVIIHIANIEMLVPWGAQRLQVMQHTPRPNVDSAVGFIVFVPGTALLRPDGQLSVPGIDVAVDVRGGALADLEGFDAVFLHLLAALQGVFELDFVRGESAALPPVAGRSVDDEVIGELRAGDTQIDIWSLRPLLLHDCTVNADDFEVRHVCNVEPSRASYDVEVILLVIRSHDPGLGDPDNLLVECGDMILPQRLEVTFSGRESTTAR